MTHAEIQELLGAFALDALEPREADAVDLHLLDCPRCRAEVADYREAAALLAFPGATAPPVVWERIQASLEEPPPQLQLARVVPLPESRLRTWGVRVLAAAAVILSVLALGVALTSRRGATGVDLAITRAAVHPDAKHVHLVSAEASRRAEVVLLNGQGYLAEHSLPPLEDDRSYQLWGLQGDTKVSLGVLGPKPSRMQFAAVADYDSLAITVEDRSGAPQPTGAAVASGWVPTSRS